MSEKLPVKIDAVTFADRGRRIQGHVPLAAFKRLAGWLSGTDGSVDFDLGFSRGDDGRRWLLGHVTGSFELECQRCLETFSLPLDWAFELVLVESEAEAATLPDAIDAVVVGSERAVHTVDLLEDEVILALPLVPRCEVVRRCQPAVEPIDADRVAEEELEQAVQRPFEDLDDHSSH